MLIYWLQLHYAISTLVQLTQNRLDADRSHRVEFPPGKVELHDRLAVGQGHPWADRSVVHSDCVVALAAVGDVVLGGEAVALVQWDRITGDSFNYEVDL